MVSQTQDNPFYFSPQSSHTFHGFFSRRIHHTSHNKWKISHLASNVFILPVLVCLGSVFLQSILNHYSSRTFPCPFLYNGLKQIISPFEIQYTKRRMGGNEHHGPVKQGSRRLNAFRSQTKKGYKNTRVNNTPNQDPCRVKHCRNKICHHWRDGGGCFEDHPTHNQKPGVDFHG